MKWILSIALLLAASVSTFAQESLVDRMSKMERRIDSIETKLDRIADFLSSQYGPGVKASPVKTTAFEDPNCVNGVCAVPTTSSATRAGLFNGGGLFHRGGLLSRIHLPRLFKGGCR